MLHTKNRSKHNNHKHGRNEESSTNIWSSLDPRNQIGTWKPYPTKEWFHFPKFVTAYRKGTEKDHAAKYKLGKSVWKLANDLGAIDKKMGSSASSFPSFGSTPSSSTATSSSSLSSSSSADPYGNVWKKIDAISTSSWSKKLMDSIGRRGKGGKGDGVTVATTVAALEMTGDQKLQRLRLLLESFGIERDELQVMFQEEFIQSALSIIYRGEWEQNFDDIMRKNRVQKMCRERFVICPRRFGKTWSVAMFCAAFIWVIPNVTVSIFSRGKRMAQKLMMLCLRFLLKLPGCERFVIKCNNEEVRLRFSLDDERVLCCLPGSVEVCNLLSI
jgi:hypothetical protein